MALDNAIKVMQEDVDSYNQGTNQQPAEGSTEWFVLRAKALGLSHLKRLAQLKLHGDPTGANRFYQACSKQFKLLDVPDPVLVDREKLPDGSLPTGVVS